MAAKHAAKVWLCTASVVFVTTSAHATITVDGTLNESDYGTPAPGSSALSTQTINSSFGSNQLDAAYGVVENSTLFLFFAGNFQGNGNRLQIWIDDGRAGGQSVLAAATGAGNMNVMNGSTFAGGFHATFALEMNVNNTPQQFFMDQYNLLSNTATHLGAFPVSGGIGSSQNIGGIAAGYNNTVAGPLINGSATSGATGSAANMAAAQTMATGIELGIPLSNFGSPTSIKVFAGINGGNDSGLANQMLPGLPVGTPSVKAPPTAQVPNPFYVTSLNGSGQPQNSMKFNFSSLTNQFFTVNVPVVPNGNWLPTGGGSWGTAGNWSNSVIPNVVGDGANFSSATGPSIVTMDGMHTVSTLSFNSTNSYTIAPGGGGVLVMDNGASSATINDFNGGHTISAPVVLNSDTTVTEQNHGDVITMSGNISGVGSLIVSNSGIFNATHSTLVLSGNNSYTGATNISRGELQLASSTALPAGTNLIISSSSPHGVLDLKGFSAVVSSLSATGAAAGTNPLATVTTTSTTPGTAIFAYAGSAGSPSTFKGTFSDNASAGGSALQLLVASGSLTLTGNDTYTGGTQISSGATAVFASVLTDPVTHLNTGSALPINSSVVNDGSLVLSNSATANSISGAGSTTVSSGTLAVTTLNQGALTIAEGSKVKIAAGGSNTVHLAGLTTGGGAQLDLNDNGMVVTYSSSSPVDSIRALLSDGFVFGSWDGNGIASTAAHNDPAMQHALGYRDTGSEVDVAYTYYGDNNLDGTVSASDFQMLLDGLATGGTSWSQGDYTYDGVVDLGNDVTLFLKYLSLNGNPGALVGVIENDSVLSSVQKAQLLSVVPEPSSLLVAGAAACVFAARRRRN